MASCPIHTHGGTFDVLNPDPALVEIEALAHSLSFQCRFNGHVKFHFSVAQHSLLVAERLLELTGDPGLALWGLLHDGSECFLPDIVSPLKPHIQGFKELELRNLAAVATRFGLPWPEPAEVKAVDLEVLAAEREQVISETDRSAWRPLPPPPPGLVIEPIPAGEAKEPFLRMFHELVARLDAGQDCGLGAA